MSENLILVTTRHLDARNKFFYRENPNIIELEDHSDIFRVEGESIFARPLLINDSEDQQDDSLLVEYAKNAFNSLSPKERAKIKRILFYIHGKDIGYTTVVHKKLDNIPLVLNMKNEESLKELDIHIIAFKHQRKTYWGNFMYNRLENPLKRKWSELIYEKFDAFYK